MCLDISQVVAPVNVATEFNGLLVMLQLSTLVAGVNGALLRSHQ